MAENIRNINKQIASFVLLSAALALPTVSSSAATNYLIADASMTLTPQSATQGAMMFYAAPSVPVDVQPITPVQPQPPMAFYASPSVPVIIEPVTPVQPQPPMAFYASPSIPTIPEATIKVNPSSAAKQVSSNIVEQDIVSNIKQNAAQINSVNAVYKITPNPNMKTDGFVNSEYGNVKVVEPYAHFIFK